MDEVTVKENLKKNVVEYFRNKNIIESMELRQEELKGQNLTFVKMLGLRKKEYVEFDDVGLQIQLIETIKTDYVDEDGIMEAYGRDKIDCLKVLPAKQIEAAIKTHKLPPEAIDFIIKKDPVEHTRITSMTAVIDCDCE